ncbi:MAG: hypothetical protein ACHQLA_02475 [Ignavibacteriales bacterium]
MRNFQVILTYKSLNINQFLAKNIFINKQKILEVELDDSHCLSPEEFCDAVIALQERPEVVRINVVEKNKSSVGQLNWITENFGRIYFHNGIPLVLNKN